MPKRSKSYLKGKTLMDFSSPMRILETFGNNDRAIREEYSRQRSIIRKRIERLELAGEVNNWLYQRFGNFAIEMPTARELTTKQMMMIMKSSAGVLSGAYQDVTLRSIKKSQREAFRTAAKTASHYGDKETADILRTPKAKELWEQIIRVYGMIKPEKQTIYAMLGEAAHQVIKRYEQEEKRKGGPRNISLITIAGSVAKAMGMDKDKTIADIKKVYTGEGKKKPDFKKAKKARGQM